MLDVLGVCGKVKAKEPFLDIGQLWTGQDSLCEGYDFFFMDVDVRACFKLRSLIDHWICNQVFVKLFAVCVR